MPAPVLPNTDVTGTAETNANINTDINTNINDSLDSTVGMANGAFIDFDRRFEREGTIAARLES